MNFNFNFNVEFKSNDGEVIVGGDGTDIVFARGGNDIIFGGGGNDKIFGGKGFDIAAYSGEYDPGSFNKRWIKDKTETEEDGADSNFGVESYIFGLGILEDDNEVDIADVLNAFHAATNEDSFNANGDIEEQINNQLENLGYAVSKIEGAPEGEIIFELEKIEVEPNYLAVAYYDRYDRPGEGYNPDEDVMYYAIVDGQSADATGYGTLGIGDYIMIGDAYPTRPWEGSEEEYHTLRDESQPFTYTITADEQILYATETHILINNDLTAQGSESFLMNITTDEVSDEVVMIHGSEQHAYTEVAFFQDLKVERDPDDMSLSIHHAGPSEVLGGDTYPVPDVLIEATQPGGFDDQWLDVDILIA